MTQSKNTSQGRRLTFRLGCILWGGAVSALGCSGEKESGRTLSEDSGAPSGGQGGGGNGSPEAGPAAGAPTVEAGAPDPQPDAGRDAGGVVEDASVPPDSGDVPDASCTPQPGASTIVPPALSGDAGAPLCFGLEWGAGAEETSLTSPSNQRLRAMTPDELLIAWVAPSSEAGNPTVIHYAERFYPTDPFSAPRTLAAGPYAANEGMALSADGLRLVVVLPDLRGFTEYTRVTRDDPFSDEPSEAQFTTLNTQISHYLGATAHCGDPVLSSDDLTFYFTASGLDVNPGEYGGYDKSYSVYSSTRIPYVEWPAGEVVMGSMLLPHCNQLRRPTAISSDELTLFYWDELTSSARAAFRPSIGAPFDSAVDLGNLKGAQVSSDCTHLYYSGDAGGPSTDILVAVSSD